MFAIEVIKLMNSAEALKRANAHKRYSAAIDWWVQRVAEDIAKASRDGKTSLETDPFAGSNSLNPPTAEERRALNKHLRANGYTVKGGIVSWGKKR